MYYRVKNYVILSSVIIIFLITTACAGRPDYKPPTHINPENQEISIKIDRNFNQVWNSLIEYASGSFFGIRNFEKDSGLLTLDFGSDNPSIYIDCGWIRSVGIDYNGPVVKGLQQYGQGKLEGRMNIFVKSISDHKTLVNVKTRYVFSAIDQGQIQTWSFDSRGSDTKPIGVVSVTCKPTGKAEKAIINGIEKIAIK